MRQELSDEEMERVHRILKECEGVCSNGFIGLLDALESFSVTVLLRMEEDEGIDFMRRARNLWASKMTVRFHELLNTIYCDDLLDKIRQAKREDEAQTNPDGITSTINED